MIFFSAAVVVFFPKNISGILLARFPNILKIGSRSGPIWVQTVCKGYQQTTKFAASKESIMQINRATDNRVYLFIYFFLFLNTNITCLRFEVLRPSQYAAMVMSRWSAHLTTLIHGQANMTKRLNCRNYFMIDLHESMGQGWD